MTLSEFRAWFEGFTDNMSKPPTAEQWKKIKAKVKQIDGEPITERIFIGRYWPRPYRPYWHDTIWLSGSSDGSPNFSSRTAMYAAGKADAANQTGLA